MAEFYRVSGEERISQIAQRLNVSAEAIKRINAITEIYEGQLLLIPSRGMRTVTVRPFEDWQTLSARTGVSVQEIKKKNSVAELYPFLTLFLE